MKLKFYINKLFLIRLKPYKEKEPDGDYQSYSDSIYNDNGREINELFITVFPCSPVAIFSYIVKGQELPKEEDRLKILCKQSRINLRFKSTRHVAGLYGEGQGVTLLHLSLLPNYNSLLDPLLGFHPPLDAQAKLIYFPGSTRRDREEGSIELGGTPLHWAMQLYTHNMIDKKIVETLLDFIKKFNPNQTNNNQTNENQTNDNQTNENQTNANQTNANQTNDNQTNDNQTNDNQTNANQTNENQTNANQTNDNQTNANQTNENQTNANQYIVNIRNQFETQPSTVLHIVCRSVIYEFAERLIELGALVKGEKVKPSLLITAIGNTHHTSILRLVKLLLDKNADIEESDEDKFTPLVLATKANNYHLVELLLDKKYKADKEVETLAGMKPYEYAPKEGPGIGIQRKLQPKFFDDIIKAIQEDNADKIKEIFGANPDWQMKMQDFLDYRGWSALMYSALYRSDKAAKELVRLTFNHRLSDKNKFSALMWANWSKCQPIVDLLCNDLGMRLTNKEIHVLRRLQNVSNKNEDNATLLSWTGEKDPIEFDNQPEEASENALKAKMEDSFDSNFKRRIHNFIRSDYVPVPLYTGWLLRLNEDDIPGYKTIKLKAKLFVTIKVAENDIEYSELSQILAIYLYSLDSSIYKLCNKSMREGNIGIWEPFIFWVESALLSIEPISETVPLYRGVNKIKGKVEYSMREYYRGNKVIWPAFSSSSTDKDVALSFLSNKHGLLFQLTSYNGRKIHMYSDFPWEDEVLFPSNSVFKVVSNSEPIYDDLNGEVIQNPIREKRALEVSKGRSVFIDMNQICPNYSH
eukprot:NODE_519_length_2644_cov_35.337564_g444_i2.p1 GENE.NODE_519_length_2644_cov_35.337564_g444_i2~~NODE_519_length_2644_cov_35.337564_g444_i2.p1  ORF type:complete len:828 (-),score=154.02 NODE_519_length_2644_cov_35.337564_g444_i2:160-2589(-)